MIKNILVTMFAWPQGIVVGNLIASVLWATPAFIHLHMRMNKHHRRIEDLHGRLSNNSGDKSATADPNA